MVNRRTTFFFYEVCRMDKNICHSSGAAFESLVAGISKERDLTSRLVCVCGAVSSMGVGLLAVFNDKAAPILTEVLAVSEGLYGIDNGYDLRPLMQFLLSYNHEIYQASLYSMMGLFLAQISGVLWSARLDIMEKNIRSEQLFREIKGLKLF